MATTKTEQNIQKPKLPQSAIYRKTKQDIIEVIRLSELPVWVLEDMLVNITAGVQTASEQVINAEMSSYNKQLEIYESQKKEVKQ